MEKIGIIGCGFVGTAVEEGMKHCFGIEKYDLDSKKSSVPSLKALLSLTKIVFICVPTPMNNDGSCNTSIVEQLIGQINEIDRDTIAVIKSTVVPGTCLKLSEKYKNVQIIFNPEFLTEANAINDFKNQNRIVLGGKCRNSLGVIEKMYNHAYPGIPLLITDHTTAEMVKYTTNCFLAVKVSFANEMYQISEKLGINYSEMIKIVQADERLGKSHWKVPGPVPSVESGKLLCGFSGSCLVKELNACINLANKLDVQPTMMNAAWEKNIEVREERDWEKLIGRAVTEG